MLCYVSGFLPRYRCKCRHFYQDDKNVTDCFGAEIMDRDKHRAYSETSGTRKGCALRATLLSPLTFLSSLLLVGTQCIASEEFCCRGEVCSPENTSSVGAPLAGALFVLVIVNVPVIAVGCGPMCPPENTSSVRPLPNPPQREGTMIPTKPCRSVFSACSVP